jgi:hypothetical protein
MNTGTSEKINMLTKRLEIKLLLFSVFEKGDRRTVDPGGKDFG